LFSVIVHLFDSAFSVVDDGCEALIHHVTEFEVMVACATGSVVTLTLKRLRVRG
jgi:hypothetical protein